MVMTDETAGRSITLRDGRRLGYAEFGDGRGRPVIYCHGFPGSRREAGLADAAARRQGVRLIAVDRPGYGLSDDQPGRQLLDWPSDVAALADTLGIDRFEVLGVSGGGPFALACAAWLAERVRGVTLVCPLGALGDPSLYPELPRSMRAVLFGLRRFPATMRWLGGCLLALVRRRPERALKLLLTSSSAVDRQLLRRPELFAAMAASAREAFAGRGRGAVGDLAIYTATWDFPLGGIGIPVRIWHGAADRSVPRVLIEHLAAALPRCELRLVREEGHFSLPIQHMDEILHGLMEPPGI